MLNIKTTVIMPDNAPATKLEAATEYGATVVQYDPKTEAREEIAKEFVDNQGYTLIPS